MTLQEIMKDIGREYIRRKGWNNKDYRINLPGLLFYNMDNQLYSFSGRDILADDWEFYSPEPEKCEACKEVEEIKKEHGFFRTSEINNLIWHLQKHHCTCKEGK